MSSKSIQSVVVSAIYLILGFVVIVRMIKNFNLSHSVGMALQNPDLDHDSKIKLMAGMKSLALESMLLIVGVVVVGIFFIGLIISNWQLRSRLELAQLQQNKHQHSSR